MGDYSGFCSGGFGLSRVEELMAQGLGGTV